MSIIKTKNPATETTIASYTLLDEAGIDDKIEQAHHQFLEWRQSNFADRSKLMKQAANLLRERTGKYAQLISEEMGKPIVQSKAEIEKCAWVCDFYAEKAGRFLLDERMDTEMTKSYVRYQPLGVVLAVMPWNYPFWQVFRFAAPALMAGNAGLLKHASNVPGCALAIEEVFRDAGFPKGLFASLLISSDATQQVIKHKLVRAVTLTGSEKAGAAVASLAGSEIKKSVLELGGSDPYIILEDADIELAAKECAQSRLLNTGQSCIGAKRFIVMHQVYDRFLELFRQHMAEAKMGDPLQEDTRIGPMARNDLREELHQQVQKSIEGGAECILGGSIPEGPGAYYPPTILINIKPGTPAYEEELFGPVASVFKVRDEKEAVRLANDSAFGLGAAVFTKNLERGENIASQLEAGCCFVNAYVKSDPRFPFGGIKSSGYGRELSHHGIREFVNVKTIVVA